MRQPLEVVRLEPNFVEHAKVIGLSDRAFRLHVHGLCYSMRRLTDGFVQQISAESLAHSLLARDGALLVTADDTATLIGELVGAGLWDLADGGYAIHDFADYQETRASLEARRGRWRRHKQLHGSRSLKARVRERDGDHCRYCGLEVDFNDRRGKQGGTYDHVDPSGENTLENIVVACRSCNGRKGDRTPAESGMLLPPPRNQVVSETSLKPPQKTVVNAHARDSGGFGVGLSTPVSLGSAVGPLERAAVKSTREIAAEFQGSVGVGELHGDFGDLEPFRRIAAGLKGADARTPVVLASVMRGKPEAVLAQALERLERRRANRARGPLVNEAKYVVSTIRELGQEARP